MDKQSKEIDGRKYSRTTNRNLIIGAILLLFIVGGGLIAWLYGFGAASLAVICLVGGLLLAGVIYLVFFFIDRIVKNANRE